MLLDAVSKGKLRAVNKFSKNEKYKVFIITVGTPLDKDRVKEKPPYIQGGFYSN